MDKKDFSLLRTRDFARLIFEKSQKGSTHFSYHAERWDDCVHFVKELILQNYPDLNIPFHSRLEHFRAASIDRVPGLQKTLETKTPMEQLCTWTDLVVVSVLLDAGAGDLWKYKSADGSTLGRSEGLALATWDAFLRGDFSSEGSGNPLRVDAACLEKFRLKDLEEIFQVSSSNPLLGLEGRFGLLKSLGKMGQRPSDLWKKISLHEIPVSIRADQVLKAVLEALSPIWPTGGDVWFYPIEDEREENVNNWIPFHKLSQWLSYSLCDVLQMLGCQVAALDSLTGLPEYRNGGLFLDQGVLQLRNPPDADKTWDVGSDLVVEWRALTVFLLDQMGESLRVALGVKDLPLVKVLQGGTWLAGRVCAQKLRQGLPPLNIQSDATVF